MVFGKGPLVEDNDNRRKCCFCPGCADFFSQKQVLPDGGRPSQEQRKQEQPHETMESFFLEFREKTNAAVK